MISTEISPDVSALVEALCGVSTGATISYAALSEVIGRNITDVRYLLHSAQRVAARDHGVVFANERGKGYTRLSTEQLAGVGSTARSRVRRASRKASKVIRAGLDRANDVAPEIGRKLNAELSALALIEHVATDKAAAPIKAHEQRPEPVAVTARRLFPVVAA